jgi:ATP-binding cassette subfamily B multidrug efflux pump
MSRSGNPIHRAESDAVRNTRPVPPAFPPPRRPDTPSAGAPADAVPARGTTLRRRPALSIATRIRPQVTVLAAGVLFLLATNALGLTIPWLLKSAIDLLRALQGQPGGTETAAVAASVTRLAALIAAAAAGQAIVRTLSRVFIFNAGRNVEFDLRQDLFAHLLRLDPGFYRRHATGDLMSRLTNDLSAVRMLFGPGILNVANTAIVYVTGVWLLVHLSPRLTLVALVPYPALIVSARLWSRSIYGSSRALQDQLGVLSTTLQEDLAGIAVVKSYALEESRHAAFARQSQIYLDRALALARARGGLTPLFAVIGALGTLIVLWVGGREVIAGRMTLGELVAFNAYLVYLSLPTIALGWILAVWQRGLAAWVRVRDLLSVVPAVDAAGSEIADAGALGRPEGLSPSVSIRGLGVVRDGRTILDDICLEVPAGGSLAVVGPTGSGKTTLVDAVPRFVEVPPGCIFVGGRDVHDLPTATLRGLIGYAPQEAFLFSATVAENVAFGLPDGVTGEERAGRIARAVEAAGLGPDLAALPEGLDTLVGERGITLSGGQRQRLALARALAAEPAILILDDSLSSVDAHTERDILARLRPILRGRTSILVSHRVRAVRQADVIVVLDRGRVAERGTHAQLLEARGLYASLYREQLAAEALGAGANA